jgi:hypothetical protein
VRWLPHNETIVSARSLFDLVYVNICYRVFYPLSEGLLDDTIMQLRTLSVQHVNISCLVKFGLLVNYKSS